MRMLLLTRAKNETGRWRLACILTSFLHASARGGPPPIVLLHDCERRNYHHADHLFHYSKTMLEGKLCRYERKANTTDEQIKEAWLQHHQAMP